MTASAAGATISAIFRSESPRVIARLSRIVRDVGRAEELLQEALVLALEQWPRSGVPENPGAWLMATAKHRAFNDLRRGRMIERKHDELAHGIATATDGEHAVEEAESSVDDVGDDLLRLMFTACHPVLPTEARVALTLRLLGGLTTEEIARAFLLSEPTVAQRIVRAKRMLGERQIAFEYPRSAELAARLASVLEVVYLIFNEGYAATAGYDVLRPALCDEALRLGRVLAELAPSEPEVFGLMALMELNASRTAARTAANGEPILLMDQDRARWDAAAIARGLAALDRAEALQHEPGPYALQAAISACHARAAVASHTDWTQIAELYAALYASLPSPVVALNRAMAVAMSDGPARGLELVDELARDPRLHGYHLLPSARADLLFKLGRFAEARSEFERAAALTENHRQRERLLARAAACGGKSP